MHKRVINRDGFRKCFRCKEEFPLSQDFFHKEKSRLFGLSYSCKSCQKQVSKAKPKRLYRWSEMTEQQKMARKSSMKKWMTSAPTAWKRIASYRAYDKKKGLQFDLTVEWYEKNISGHPCHYCGDVNSEIGCDRIDNSAGHTQINVVPACAVCNITRSDTFSYEEMIVLGDTIRKLKERRVILHSMLRRKKEASP